MISRTNTEVCRAKCKLLCNTAYVDSDVIKDVLIDRGIDPEEEAVPNNVELMRCAILIVLGWVETSRSEGGVSVSIDLAALRNNIYYWCSQYGIDVEEFNLVDALSYIRNGFTIWPK